MMRKNQMQMEAVEPCVCGGTRDDVEVKAAKSNFVLYWRVRCGKCGRETAKHKTPEGAVHEWNSRESEAE